MPDVDKAAVRPWWAPDAQGIVIGAVVLYVGAALFLRMRYPTEVNDKLLDMMLTILFGTAFVGIVNYLVGSSRGSDTKTESQNRIVERLASAPAAALPAPAPAPTSWWALLTGDERSKINEAAPRDQRIQNFTISAAVGKAETDDLAYLVRHGLLTQDRATAIAAS